MKKLIKYLASLKLAVLVIISLSVLTAIGTVVESKYDAYAAKKMVYDTFWMYSILGTLVVNLIAVIVDRYPWKQRHLAFIFAHVGIIILLFGGLLTFKFGLDGTLRIGVGEKARYVQTAETDVVVYSSFDGDSYSKTFEHEVDFFNHPPSAEKPFKIPTMKGDIQIIDYKKYVIPSRKVTESQRGNAGVGVRLQIQNKNANTIEWIVQNQKEKQAKQSFGPLTVYLGELPAHGQKLNEIHLKPIKNGTELEYVLFGKENINPIKKGKVSEGGVIQTPWMSSDVRVLRLLPRAEEQWDIQELSRPTPLTVAAVLVLHEGRKQWVLLNDMLKVFTENAAYLLTFGNRRIDLGFEVQLKKFDIDRYQGTMRAMSYRSVVAVPDLNDVEISMNEPMKYKKLTFYQASFQEDEMGKPIASILSVNQDPGRFFKYLGSLIMSLGIIFLFYFKRMEFINFYKKGNNHDSN